MSAGKTITEVRVANAQLQNDIFVLIRRFEDEMGVVVNGVDLIHSATISGDRETVAVRVETSL